MKKFTFLILMTASIFLLSGNPADAKGWHKHEYSLEHKVYTKVKKIKEYHKELGFSEQDVKKAIDTKMALKKDLIQLNADLDIVKLDIKSAKHADNLDLAKINTLIDQKYEIKKKKAKRIFESYAQVKSMFDEDKKEKLKEMYEEKMKDKDKVCFKCMKKYKKHKEYR